MFETLDEMVAPRVEGRKPADHMVDLAAVYLQCRDERRKLEQALTALTGRMASLEDEMVKAAKDGAKVDDRLRVIWLAIERAFPGWDADEQAPEVTR